MIYRPCNVSTQPTSWWKLNETSGTRYDTSGSNDLEDHIIYASPEYMTGITETYATVFSGPHGSVRDYLKCASPTGFDFAGSFSVAFWMWKSVGTDSTDACVMRYSRVSPYKGFFVTVSGGGYSKPAGKIAFGGYDNEGNNWELAIDNGDAISEEWCHVACVYDYANLKAKIYINGINKKELSITYPSGYTAGVPLYVGSNGEGDGNDYYSGGLQDVAFWNSYVLTDAEIYRLSQLLPFSPIPTFLP